MRAKSFCVYEDVHRCVMDIPNQYIVITYLHYNLFFLIAVYQTIMKKYKLGRYVVYYGVKCIYFKYNNDATLPHTAKTGNRSISI